MLLQSMCLFMCGFYSGLYMGHGWSSKTHECHEKPVVGFILAVVVIRWALINSNSNSNSSSSNNNNNNNSNLIALGEHLRAEHGRLLELRRLHGALGEGRARLAKGIPRMLLQRYCKGGPIRRDEHVLNHNFIEDSRNDSQKGESRIPENPRWPLTLRRTPSSWPSVAVFITSMASPSAVMAWFRCCYVVWLLCICRVIYVICVSLMYMCLCVLSYVCVYVYIYIYGDI